MPEKTKITSIEQGRAEFAYKCASQTFTIKPIQFSNKEIKTHEIIIQAIEAKVKKSENWPDGFLENYQTNPYLFCNSSKDTLEYKLSKAFKKFGGEYKSIVKKIPMMMKTNGIGPTFGFIYSKGKDPSPHQLIYRQTSEWLKNDFKQFIDLSQSNGDLMQAIVEMDSTIYRAVTQEVFAFYNWLRRFVDGMIEGEDE